MIVVAVAQVAQDALRGGGQGASFASFLVTGVCKCVCVCVYMSVCIHVGACVHTIQAHLLLLCMYVCVCV